VIAPVLKELLLPVDGVGVGAPEVPVSEIPPSDVADAPVIKGAWPV